MKNILLIFYPNELGVRQEMILIDSLSKLDNNNHDHMLVKKAIVWLISKYTDSNYDESCDFEDWLSCGYHSDPDGWLELDDSSYSKGFPKYMVFDILSNIYGFSKIPYKVEHEIYVFND